LKILITGFNGMLGSACRKKLGQQHSITGIDLRQDDNTDSCIHCDIAVKDELVKYVTDCNPDVIIHTAACSDVDGCELNPDEAFKINVTGTKNVTEAAHRCGAALFYISTDYVFDGKKQQPYTEKDTTGPVNVYGKTKLEGERIVQAGCRKHFIIRTSWLFGEGGKNFPDTILQLAKTKGLMEIVSDKYSCPTYTKDLTFAIGDILSLLQEKDAFGIYHITNNGSCSWFEFAREALDLNNMGHIKLMPIPLSDFSRPAEVPKMSALDSSLFKKMTGSNLRTWTEALKDYINSKERMTNESINYRDNRVCR